MSRRPVTRFALAGVFAAALAAPALSQTPPRAPSPEPPVVSFGLPGLFQIDLQVEHALAGPALKAQPKGLLEVEFRIDFNSKPVAPMPRAKERTIEEYYGVGGPVHVRVSETQAVSPMTPPAPPQCAFDRQPAQAVMCGPVPREMPASQFTQAAQVQFLSFAQGRDLANRQAPLPTVTVTGGGVHRPASQVVLPVCCPLTGGPTAVQPPLHADMRFVYPYAGVTAIRCDEQGNWWVKVEGVPQPNHVQGNFFWRCDGCSPNERTYQLQLPAPATNCPAGKPVVIDWQPGFNPIPCGEPQVVVRQVVSREVETARSSCLSGTWVREVEGMVIAVTFAGDEMKLCMTQRIDCSGGETPTGNGNGDCLTICMTLTADYAVTKEGVVHGIITGIDVNSKCDAKSGPTSQLGAELLESAGQLQQVVDCPFSFRIKNTSVGMMASNIKFAGFKELSSQELAPLCGLFQPCKDGRIPQPKPTQPRLTVTYSSDPQQRFQRSGVVPPPCAPVPVGVCAPATVCPVPVGVCPPATVCPAPCVLPLVSGPVTVCPAPCVLPAVGGPVTVCPQPCLPPCAAAPPAACPPPCVLPQGYGTLVPMMNPPYPPGPVSWDPPQSQTVPPSEFEMMATAFGQMLGVPAGQPQCNPPAPGPVATVPQYAAAPCPVQPVGYPSCAPAPTVAQAPTAVVRPASATRQLTGTWVRGVGPVLYVVKFAPDHLTVTATASVELPDGTTCTDGIILSADYHLSRDGVTAVGLITGVDAVVGGSPPVEGLSDMGQELARVQKALTDKPLALNVRLYGDVLVIGNVRLPEVENGPGPWSPLSVLGGRYTANDDKPLPKPKPTKVSGLRSMPPVCDSPRLGPYGTPLSEYAPPSPPYPTPESGPSLSSNPDLLPPNRVPVQPARVAAPLPTAPASEVIPPPPGAYGGPVPRYAPVPAEPQPGKKKGKKKATQNERIQQLLQQSEDLRQIRDEWQRFWFHDQPGHLTPERIHGGII